MDVLILCTANQCRSPMAEVLLQRHLDRAGVEARVSSAGLMEGGVPATSHGQEAMARRGLDLGAHTSRRFDPDMLRGADLVIGMTREHVREAAVLAPDVLARTFTLKELVAAAGAKGPRRPGESLEDWLARLAQGRRREDLLGIGHDDAYDVADPVGRGRQAYDVTADLLDDLLARLVDAAFSAATIDEGQRT